MPSIVTRIILSLNEDSVGETVSLRSETDQLLLFSELINVTVTQSRCFTLSQLASYFIHLLLIAVGNAVNFADVSLECSCSSEVGIAVGSIILLESLVVMVIIIIVVMVWWR